MTGTSAFIYSEDYLKYNFGPTHPFKPRRCRKTLDLLYRMEVFNHKAELVVPQPATEEDLLLVHTKEYIEFVKSRSEVGGGYLDQGDTPATRGLFEGACAVVGGSVKGGDLLVHGLKQHAFNVGGGLHHAKPDAASGFCVFNDIAIVIRRLQRTREMKRIAVVDIDGHHGDGTQQIFHHEPILTISTHRIGIFPGSGYVDEIGEGEGKGYSVNIPLPGDTGEKAYLHAFDEIVSPLLEWYRPEILLVQFGIDGHVGDPLVGMALTTRTYEVVARLLHELAHKICEGRLLLFGGGGYDEDTTVRCWALMFAVVSETLPPTSQHYKKLLDQTHRSENEQALRRVQKIIEEVKETIFPIHGIK